MNPNKSVCLRCAMPLISNAAEALCPKCLLERVLIPDSLPDANVTLELETSVPASPFTGTRLRYFGDYELLEEIARGGMGMVFKARQVNLNRLVALKLINSGALASEESIKRFKAEAEAAAALNHPNIVPIHEIGEVQGQHYFSMSLIAGPNLGDYLASKPLSLQKAAELLVLLARAVHDAHQHGVLHRDIKPTNILINTQGTPFLTDFGLAKFAQKDSTLTHTNVIMGTPSYMAPEQARGDTKNVTTAADVYGLGAVLYTCLTGHAPFAGGTTFETIRQVLERDARRPSAWNPEVDRDLETICLKCLAKDVSKRYSSAEAVALDLEHWLNSEPIEARAATTYERLQKWVRRRPAIAVLTALSVALLLVAGIGGTFYSFRLKAAAMTLEENLYATEMGVAFAEWNRGNATVPRELLDMNLPGRRQSRNLRGFEWYYLDALCQPKELFTIPRQTNQIFGLACSPDGKLVAAAQLNRTIRLIDLVARRDVGILDGLEAGYSLAFDQTGKRLLSSTFTNKVLPVWDVERKSVITNLPISGVVLSAVFSPDGKLMVSSTGELYNRSKVGDIVLWSGATYEQLYTFPKQAASAWETVFSPDSHFLATAQGDGTILLWDIETRKLILSIEAHADIVSALAFSPDGKLLASGSLDEGVSLWTVPDFRQIPLGRHERVDSVAFSPDGKWLASSARDQTIKIWNLENRRAKPILLRGHAGRIWAIASTADGHLVSGCVDGNIKVWDWAAITHQAPSPRDTKLGLSFSPDCDLNFSDDETGTVVRSVISEEIVAKLPIKGAICSPNGQQIIGLAMDATNTLQLLDRTFHEITSIATSHRLSSPLRFSPDGKWLAVRRSARSFELRNPARNYLIEKVVELAGYPSDFTFSSDGKYLAVPCNDIRTVELFDLHTREFARASHLPLHVSSSLVLPAVWIPNTHRLAIGSGEPVIEFRDIDTGEVQPLKLGSGNAWALAPSPDGRTLAVGTQDGFIQLINTPTLRVMATLRGHLTDVGRMGFSPDGTMLLSSGGDGTRLWSARILLKSESAQ